MVFQEKEYLTVFIPSKIKTNSIWICISWNKKRINVLGTFNEKTSFSYMKKVIFLIRKKYKTKTDCFFISKGVFCSSLIGKTFPIRKLFLNSSIYDSDISFSCSFLSQPIKIILYEIEKTFSEKEIDFFKERKYFLLLTEKKKQRKRFLFCFIFFLLSRKNISIFVLTLNKKYKQKFIFGVTTWLAGWPLGMKLNTSLNRVLGETFFFISNVWSVFIERTVFANLEKILFCIFISFCFDFSFGLFFLEKFLFFLTFFQFIFCKTIKKFVQKTILIIKILFLLLNGKRNNILRGRTDYIEHETDSILLGSFFFVVLFFLLPTILVCSTVFYFSCFIFLSLRYLFLIFVFVSSFPFLNIFYLFIEKLLRRKRTKIEILMAQNDLVWISFHLHPFCFHSLLFPFKKKIVFLIKTFYFKNSLFNITL